MPNRILKNVITDALSLVRTVRFYNIVAVTHEVHGVDAKVVLNPNATKAGRFAV